MNHGAPEQNPCFGKGSTAVWAHIFILLTYEGLGFYFSFVDIYLYESGPPPNKHAHTHTLLVWRSDNCPTEASRGGGLHPINCRYPVPSPLPTAVISTPNRTYTRRLPKQSQCRGQQNKDKIWALSITLSFPNRAGVHAKITIRRRLSVILGKIGREGGAGIFFSSRNFLLKQEFLLVRRESAEVRSADLFGTWNISNPA